MKLPSIVVNELSKAETAAGQLWELDEWWARVIGFSTSNECYHLYLLLTPAPNDMWWALRIGTSELVEVQISSLMYDRVA